MSVDLQSAIDALTAHDCKPTPSGSGYIAYCPVHESDHNGHKPSLSLAQGHKQSVLLNCHAGCTYPDIMSALGLKSDPAPQHNGKRRIVATYAYRDATGQVVSEKVRYEPKDFRQRWPDGAGGWLWKKPPLAPAVLYRLPELLAGIQAGLEIYVVEGEKDADRLMAGGLIATCNIEGASKGTDKPKWRKEYTAQLTGAARVILIPDHDEPGRSHMAAIAQALRGKVSDVRTLELPGLSGAKGDNDVSDWLNAGHTVDELRALAESAKPGVARVIDVPVPTDSALNPYRGTDDANADLFLQQHGADTRYCPPWKEWLIWTGTHWRRDDRLDIERLAADVPKLLRERAARLTGQVRGLLDRMAGMMNLNPLPAEYGRLRSQQTAASDEVDWLLKLAGKLEGTAKRGCMLMAARHKVVVHHTALDTGHYLLNARNGTINLKTGQLRRHDPQDLLTHDTEIIYDPQAVSTAWLDFLRSIFAGDTELIAFVQRAVGYSLTGDVREQVLLICHGVGSNGKSVFLNILRKLLGMLAMQAAPDLLMQDKQRRHPTEQADLFAKRLVVCQETGEGRRFNETLVKQLTGGDGIRARRMQEDFWEFEPTHKLWLSTNHKPEIRGTDHAIWRRIRLIPFTVTFTDDGPARKDPDMERKLEAELPGILAWAVAGCLDWQRQGLQPPTAVVEATHNYQAEMDVLAAWMQDCCVVKKHCETKASDLYANYCAWCEQSGEFAGKQRKFGMQLKERGFESFTSNGSWWRGIGLLATEDGTNGRNGTRKGNFRESEKSSFPIAKIAISPSVPSVPSENTPNEPFVESFDSDTQALMAVLRLYRGWADPGELARKSRLGSQERVLLAAQSLANAGLALIEKGMVKPSTRLLEMRP